MNVAFYLIEPLERHVHVFENNLAALDTLLCQVIAWSTAPAPLREPAVIAA
jgi:hypothetical protein